MLLRFLVFIIITFSCHLSFCVPPLSDQSQLTIDLQNVSLPQAIRILAKLININVVVSPSIHGVAVMNLNHAAPADVLETLLLSHSLAKTRRGNVWLIAPQNELLQIKQDEIKWRDLEEESATTQTEIMQIKYAKAIDIAKLLQDERAVFLSKKGRVRVDERTNMICVQDSTTQLKNIRQLIHRLDISVQQIAIEARLINIDNDFERELGIQFGIKNNTDANHQGFAIARLPNNALLEAKLTALENAGHAELISNPSLFTANQQPASIEAGEEVPYQEVSESGGTAVVFKKAVLGLKVVPQILPGKKVLLQLQINQDRPSSKMVQGMPTISTRQMMTQVLVKNGQTIVLGGVYETNTESGQQAVPFLSRLPLLGLLFKQQHIRNNKRELLIFVTPRIIDI